MFFRWGLAFVITLPLLIAFLRGDLDFHMNLWGHTYLAVGYTLVLMAALQNIDAPRTTLLRSRVLREAGRYSYTLYLFHPLFISLTFTVAGRGREIVNDWLSFTLAIFAFFASVTFSVAFYWIVERRLIKRGRRLHYAKPDLLTHSK
jgi:peptidoglycan/LPS O-acetylase OafA/YrhL